MNDTSMNNSTNEEDYIDKLSEILPWQRPLTPLERLTIVVIMSMFVSFVGCVLLCLVCPRSPLRRRLFSRNKLNKEQAYSLNTITRKSLLVVPPAPPSYESIVKTHDMTDLNKLSKSPYLNIARKFSNGTVSDSDGVQLQTPSVNGKSFRSQSARSSLSNSGTLLTLDNTYILSAYPQINVELEIDIRQNFLNIHLTNGENFLLHPALDQQTEYFIRIQLLNNKILKKFYDGRKKRRSSLPMNIWKKQLEKTTKNLSRASNDTLSCNENIQFQFNRNEITLTSLRFLLFCTDRSGIQDLMFETLIRLNPSMIPKYQQIIEFKDNPQISFGEIFCGLSYLPTSERFTITIDKLRYFCKTEKEQEMNARLIVSLIHNGRRFFQKKIPLVLNGSATVDYEIKDTITEVIPQHNIQSVYVNVEFNSKANSFISPNSILLGKNTRYDSDWHKMLEYPRQTHCRWYPLLG